MSPEETPFISNAGRTLAVNTFTEWQTDSLAAASTTNYQIEGDDITAFDAVNNTTRIGNYTQISRKTVIIADTLEAENKAGRKSELAYQLAKKAAELKRDIETTACGVNQAAAAGSSSTARKTASLLAFIYTNTVKGSGGADPSYTNIPNATRTDGTTSAFTESNLKTLLQNVWTQGGNVKTLMCDGQQKQTISGFSGIATRTYYQNDKVTAAIIGAADVYVSDFGTLAIVPNRFQRHRDVFALDWDYIQIAYLRKFNQVPLAKTGDAEKRMLVVEFALKVLNQAALGGIYDLT